MTRLSLRVLTTTKCLLLPLLFASASCIETKSPPSIRGASESIPQLAMLSTHKKTLPWTVMIYAGVDSSAEPYIMPHLRAIKESSHGGVIGNIVMLVDRTEGASKDRKILGADFSDTRIFRLTEGQWTRISGGSEYPEISIDSEYDANTGDPETLRKFIRMSKEEYPADHYALVIFGHGECRSVCPDISSVDLLNKDSEDSLFVAEISEGLTVAESVDVLWVDVCSFGGIENAYQFRPGENRFHAQVMLATPPLSAPAPVARVLEKCGVIGDIPVRGPIPLDAKSFGVAAIDAIEHRLRERERVGNVVHYECWGCYDLTHAQGVKKAVDRMSRAIDETDGRIVVEEIRGYVTTKRSMHYAYIGHPRQWMISAHFDLYDLASRIADDDRLAPAARRAARDVMRETDSLVIQSVGMSRYKDFEPGKNGIFIVFPGVISGDSQGSTWESFGWYHPLDRRTHKKEFGNLAWCRDGAVEGDGRVENWFELMDKWFDEGDSTGGQNDYRY